MASTTWSSTSLAESKHSHNGKALMLLVIVVFALGVVTADHALKHEEANVIRKCLDRNGPYMVMKHIHDPTWYLLCQIDSNHWGLQAVNKDGFEKTAFSPGDGSHRALMEYLNRIAVRFKGTVPWLQ